MLLNWSSRKAASFGAGNNLATRESLEREQRMITSVDRGIGVDYGRLGGESEFKPSESTCEENRRAAVASTFWIPVILPSICVEQREPAEPPRFMK